MSVYIAVISHGHCGVIRSLASLNSLAEIFTVVIKSNRPGDDFSDFENCHWIDNDYDLGFGDNNNYCFEYCKRNLGMKSDDYFLVLNPDVSIFPRQISQLIENMRSENNLIATIRLFLDEEKTVVDQSIRRFPTLLSFTKSFLGHTSGYVYDESELKSSRYIDWAAGSFLCFRVDHFETLQGFDPRYFMYCEDVDICYRSYQLGYPLYLHADISAIHLAAKRNRKVFSKHFKWHVTSVVRYLLRHGRWR